MKKVLLSLLAVAALVLSCQNYDDEFAALNTKISSLESQITSLAELRTAVTGVQSSISALQSAVAAAQAAAEAADNSDAITALATSVSAIAADLVDLQTAIDGATTQADLDALKAELSTTLAALQTLIETNSASISSLILSNTELKDALEKLGVDVDSVLAANATFEGNLTITNAAELAYAKSLGNKVATIKGDLIVSVDQTDHTGGGDGTGLTADDLNPILSQITFVVGNVKIESDASLNLSSLASVSGDYIIKGHDVSDDALLSVGGDVYFDYDGAYISKIESAGNIYLVPKVIVTGSVSVTPRSGTTSIDFLALKKALSLQTIDSNVAAQHTSGASISFSNPSIVNTNIIAVGGTSTTSPLTSTNATTSIKVGQAPVISVTGGNRLSTIELHYAADVSTTNTSGSAALASLNIAATSATSVTVMARTITGAVTLDVSAPTATTGSGTVNFPELVSVGGYNSDALENNSFAKLVTIGTSGLNLDYDTSVSLPVLTTCGGNINLSAATTLTAPVLARVGSATATVNGSNITANLVPGAVSFPALTKAGNITMQLATSITASNAKVNGVDIAGLTSTVPTTIDLGSISSYSTPGTAGTISDPSTVSVLKLSKQDAAISLTGLTNATSITYLGALNSAGAAHGVAITSANAKLATLTLGGVLSSAGVDTAGSAPRPSATGTATEAVVTSSALTSISTSGRIESLTVDNNYNLKTLNALHTDSNVPGAGASILRVRDNYNLTTIKTGITLVLVIDIQNNVKLTSLDLSSVSTLPVNWAAGTNVDITVLNNFVDKTSANYTTYLGATAAAAGTTTIATYIGLTGSYTAGSASTNEVFGQSGLATLKPFVQYLQDRFVDNSASASDNSTGIVIDMNYPWHNGATPGVVTTKRFTATGASSSVGLWTELLRLQ